MEMFFNIEGNNFYDQSSVVKNGMDYNNVQVFDEINRELENILKELNPSRELYYAVNELQKSVKERDEAKISGTIKRFAHEFTMPFFVNLSSIVLTEFIKKFL